MSTIDKMLRQMERADQVMQEVVEEVGIEALGRVVDNLSGVNISLDGNNFSINVGTGNLRRMTRLEYPFLGNPLAFAVFNEANYASDIENGVSGKERVERLLRNGKISKNGGRYRVIPIDGKFITVNDRSMWNDSPPRPFMQAAAQDVEKDLEERLEKAIEEILDA